MRNSPHHDHENTSRLIARVLRELLRAEGFETIADLKVALKAQLRALRITYAPADLDAALTVLASNTALAAAAPRARVCPPDRLLSTPPVLSREEAARLLAHLENTHAVRLRVLSRPIDRAVNDHAR